MNNLKLALNEAGSQGEGFGSGCAGMKKGRRVSQKHRRQHSVDLVFENLGGLGGDGSFGKFVPRRNNRRSKEMSSGAGGEATGEKFSGVTSELGIVR